MISWETPSRTRLVIIRVTQNLTALWIEVLLESHPLSGEPETYTEVRNRCNSENHRKTRDAWRVVNLVMSSTWKFFGKLVGLVHRMVDHSRLSGPEKWWTCNGPELSCRLVFPWAFLTIRRFTRPSWNFWSTIKMYVNLTPWRCWNPPSRSCVTMTVCGGVP